jgi:hypothetical protein
MEEKGADEKIERRVVAGYASDRGRFATKKCSVRACSEAMSDS